MKQTFLEGPSPLTTLTLASTSLAFFRMVSDPSGWSCFSVFDSATNSQSIPTTFIPPPEPGVSVFGFSEVKVFLSCLPYVRGLSAHSEWKASLERSGVGLRPLAAAPCCAPLLE